MKRMAGVVQNPVFVEHEARTLAALTGQSPLACDSLIVRLGKPDEILAAMLRTNPLGEAWLLDVDLPTDTIITFSGSLAADPLELDPRTWSRPGHEALEAFCAGIEPQLEQHGKTLCFQPHRRHVLSDVQSTARFFRASEGRPFGLALDPAALLEPLMLRDIEDHLRRTIETLAPLCTMLLLRDAAVDGETQTLTETTLGRGILPRWLVRELLAANLPAMTPIVLAPAHLDEQREWLSGA